MLRGDQRPGSRSVVGRSRGLRRPSSGETSFAFGPLSLGNELVKVLSFGCARRGRPHRERLRLGSQRARYNAARRQPKGLQRHCNTDWEPGPIGVGRAVG